MEEFGIWKLLAGLGIFIFGMFLLEESISKLAGRAFKHFIRDYTSNRIKAIGTGTLATAILQSSSAVSLMVLAFVGAGILSLENSIGVIMGSNLGTTFTAWLVAGLGFKVKIEAFTLPLIGIGGLGIIFLGKSPKYSGFSKLLVGFGFLFMGLDYMKMSVEGLSENIDIAALESYGIWLFVLVGLALTAAMQSSSATIAIFLTALNSGIVSFDGAAAAVIGANLGTTVTVSLGAIGGNVSKKRLALSHMLFNLLTAAVALLLFPLLILLLKKIFDEADNVMALSAFHTVFNLLGVLLFIPFLAYFTKLLFWIIPEKKLSLTRFIDDTEAQVPEAAIASIRNESLVLLERAQLYSLRTLDIDYKLVFTTGDFKTDFDKKARFMPLPELYHNLKLMNAEITKYVAKAQKEEFSEPESRALTQTLHAMRYIMDASKTMKDVSHNFEEFESTGNVFINNQYAGFRKRFISFLIKLNAFREDFENLNHPEELLEMYRDLEKDDESFVKQYLKAINKEKIAQLEITDLLTVNRLFTRACRMLLLSLKDLLLNEEELRAFDVALEMKESLK